MYLHHTFILKLLIHLYYEQIKTAGSSKSVKDTYKDTYGIKFSFLHNCTTIIAHNDHRGYVILHRAYTNRGIVFWPLHYAIAHQQHWHQWGELISYHCRV